MLVRGLLLGRREYIYETNKSTMKDALLDFVDNFNPNNVSENYDSFEGECLDSEIVSIEKAYII